MKFPKSVLDQSRDEFFAELETRLDSPRTFVFLDTNVLAFCYRLHAQARNELFLWFEKLKSENRLFVPSWVVHEYTNNFKSAKLGDYSVPQKTAQSVERQLDALYGDAKLYVDDTSLMGSPFSDRGEYLKAFNAAKTNLSAALKILGKNLDLYQVHEDVRTNLEPVVLTSDLDKLLRDVQQTADSRYSHRLPPGFDDQSKTTNAWGDLIIWREICEYCKGRTNDFDHVVIISNDAKRDWVYCPPKRHLTSVKPSKIIPNSDPRVQLIDPRLEAEFKQSCGQRTVSVVPLAFVIEAASKQHPSEFVEISQAVQRAEQVEPTAGEDPIVSTPGSPTSMEPEDAVGDEPSGSTHESPTSTGSSDSVGAEPINLELDALRDKLYVPNEETELGKIVTALRTHDWYKQNPAISQLTNLYSASYLNKDWFVLGRNIYQAACGNASRAINFVQNLDWYLSRFSQPAANWILGGIVFEIYFDASGGFRARKKSRFMFAPLVQLRIATYGVARSFIQEKLSPFREKLYYFPGDAACVSVAITAEARENNKVVGAIWKIVSIKVADREVLHDAVVAELVDPWFAPRHGRSLGEIKEELLNACVVPQDVVTFTLTPQNAVAGKFTFEASSDD
jgi:hypothetical protein